MPHDEQDLLTLPEHLRSPPPSFWWVSCCFFFSCLCCVLCTIVCLLVFFIFSHVIVSLFSIYEYVPHVYLVNLLLSKFPYSTVAFISMSSCIQSTRYLTFVLLSHIILKTLFQRFHVSLIVPNLTLYLVSVWVNSSFQYVLTLLLIYMFEQIVRHKCVIICIKNTFLKFLKHCW